MSSPAPEDSTPSSPGEDNAPLHPPTPLTNLTPPAVSPRDSFTPSAAPLVPETEKNLEENAVEAQPERRRSLFRRPIFWFAMAAAIVVVVLAVILPVYFTVIKPKNNTSTGGGGNNGGKGGGNSGKPKPSTGLTTGGDGSTVTTNNGTTFTYHNPFGGFCVYIPFSSESQGGLSYGRITGVWDPEHPFDDNAQPNSWTPPLNTTWNWGVDKLYG